MTIEELNTLRQAEIVVFTSIDQSVTTYYDYSIGDVLTFLEFNEHTNCYNFVRLDSGPPIICHFSEDVHKYIDRKVVIDRLAKIKELGL